MKKIGTLMMALSILLLIWMSVSFLEVISKNNRANPEYSQYNAFELAVKIAS